MNPDLMDTRRQLMSRRARRGRIDDGDLSRNRPSEAVQKNIRNFRSS